MKYSAIRKTIILAILFVILVSMIGCSFIETPQKALVGEWEFTFFFATTYKFVSDGTFSTTTDGETLQGTWSATKTILTLNYDSSNTTNILYTMSSDKNSMTWTPEGGGLTITLVRK